jgi:hypothetical protein
MIFQPVETMQIRGLQCRIAVYSSRTGPNVEKAFAHVSIGILKSSCRSFEFLSFRVPSMRISGPSVGSECSVVSVSQSHGIDKTALRPVGSSKSTILCSEMIQCSACCNYSVSSTEVTSFICGVVRGRHAPTHAERRTRRDSRWSRDDVGCRIRFESRKDSRSESRIVIKSSLPNVH